jgi:hypothetical protein
MSIARSTGVFLGTDESTGVTIASGATSSGSEVDVLGDNASVGDINVYLVFTSTVTAGTLDVTVHSRRVTGQAYAARAAQFSVSPISGTQKLFLGSLAASRYMSGDVRNNATGANATNASLLFELFKAS